MHGGQFGNGKIPGYRCAAVGSKGSHRGGVIQENVAEKAVMGWLSGLADAIDTETAAKIGNKTPKPASEGAKTRLQKAIRQDTARLDTLTLKMLDGTVDQATYERLKTQLDTSTRAKEVQLRAITSAERHPVTQIIPDLLGSWGTLPLEVRRDLLSRLVERIEVGPRGSVPRAVIVPRWEGAED
jgi:hypothetical protein